MDSHFGKHLSYGYFSTSLVVCDDILTYSRASSHSLRYVLKNRATDEPLFVVIFTLVPKTEVEGESPTETDGDDGDDGDDVD